MTMFLTLSSDYEEDYWYSFVSISLTFNYTTMFEYNDLQFNKSNVIKTCPDENKQDKEKIQGNLLPLLLQQNLLFEH